MKNTRMTALNTKRKTKAIKRSSGKSKNPRLAKTPTNIKNITPIKNSFILSALKQSDILPDFYGYNYYNCGYHRNYLFSYPERF